MHVHVIPCLQRVKIFFQHPKIPSLCLRRFYRTAIHAKSSNETKANDDLLDDRLSEPPEMSNVMENAIGVSTRTELAQNSTSPTPEAMDLRVARYFVFGMIFLFSVTGNTLVILTVLILRKMRTVPMIFIANLAACDLTTTVSSIAFDLPEQELGFWPYGRILCKIIWPLATFSTNAAALTLVAISIDRFVSIICPLNLKYRITRGKCLKMILVIYCISALAVTPYSVFLTYKATDPPACEENWPKGYYLAKIYTVFLFALQYGLPLIVMSVIYTRIGLKLCKNSGKAAALSTGRSGKPRTSANSGTKLYHSASDAAEYALQKRKRQNEKTARMFLFVVVIFLVFMMPHQLLWLSLDYSSHSQTFIDYKELIIFVCRAFTYANSVLNPIIYGVCNGNFRRGCLAIVKCQCSKASQRSQARKKRTESLRVAKQNLLKSNSSFRSTTTMDSVTSTLLRENRDGRDHHLRKEVLNKKVTANGIKNCAPSLSNGSAPITVIRDVKSRNGSTVSDINGNSFRTDRPLQHNSTTSNSQKSLYENTSRKGLFALPLERNHDTSYWLSETEALLNRLCQELEVDTAGETGPFSPQLETPQGRENCTYCWNERETIL